MKKNTVLSIVAAVLFLIGLVLMLVVVPMLSDDGSVTTTVPATTQVPTTEPATEPPTEPTTQAPTNPPAETMPPQELSLTASKAFVYNCTEDYMVYAGGDMDEKIAPASLTKLLTGYVVLQYMDPAAVVTVGEEITWIDPESSWANLHQNNRLTVEMLIQGLMMQSGNDAAYTLAVACGRTIRNDESLNARDALGVFMDEMNNQARLLGLSNTHYVNPDGIDAKGHYTSCNDLVTISGIVMEDPLLMKYCGMATAKVTFESGESYTWNNSNYLLHESMNCYTPEAIGLKTGSTYNAGKCLISLFKQEDGTVLMVGVLGSSSDADRYTDTLTLYNRYK